MSGEYNKTNIISVNLRTLRAEHKLSQAALAKKLGISQQTYSKYENLSANIDSEIIIKLCKIYGISSDYLLGIDNSNGDRQNKMLNGYEKPKEEIEYIVSEVLLRINNEKKKYDDEIVK